MNLKLNAVAATILAGLLSTSVFAAPPAPTLSKPDNGDNSKSKDDNITFTWNSVKGATNYRIIISQNESFSGFNQYSLSCDSTCFTAATKTTSHPSNSRNLAGQKYYWKVRANVDKVGESPWSVVRSFTTKGAAVSSYGQSIWNEANRAYNNGEVKYYKGSALTDGKYTYCAVFVRLVFDKSYGKGKDANAVCQDYANKGVMKKSGTPSTGAAVCYKPAPSNWNAGHIAIANGSGKELGVTSVSKGLEFRTSPSYWGWISADDYKSYY